MVLNKLYILSVYLVKEILFIEQEQIKITICSSSIAHRNYEALENGFLFVVGFSSTAFLLLFI